MQAYSERGILPSFMDKHVAGPHESCCMGTQHDDTWFHAHRPMATGAKANQPVHNDTHLRWAISTTSSKVIRPEVEVLGCMQQTGINQCMVGLGEQ